MEGSICRAVVKLHCGSARPPSLPGHARRGQMMLSLAEGLSVVQVATMVGITWCCVSKGARRFLRHGIEGLADQPSGGRRPRLTTPANGPQASRREKGADPP